MFPAALGELASCYTAQEMFLEAENARQRQLSLLNKRPEHNKHNIMAGQSCCEQHCPLHAFTLVCLCVAALRASGMDFIASSRTEKAIETFGQVLEMQTSDTPTDPLDLFSGMYDTKSPSTLGGLFMTVTLLPLIILTLIFELCF